MAALILVMGSGCSEAAPSLDDGPSPSDVILLIIDTLRADHIHGYGYPRETTPTLDSFIGGGVRFDGEIAPGS